MQELGWATNTFFMLILVFEYTILPYLSPEIMNFSKLDSVIDYTRSPLCTVLTE